MKQRDPSTDLHALADKKSHRLAARRVILRYVDEIMAARSIKAGAACEHVEREAKAGALPAEIQTAARANCKTGRCLTRATLMRWRKNRAEKGEAALVSKHTGRTRKPQAWDAEAVSEYRQPQKPGFAWVARRLRERGYHDVTAKQVSSLIKTLPIPERARGRMSERERKNTVLGFIRRDWSGIKPNDLWMADGHTVDVRVLHPEFGRLTRLEITVWMDVASRMVVAAFISEKENRMAVAWAFSRAVLRWGVPLFVYTDNGPGYVAADLADPHIGLFARLGVEHMKARPYNARSKAHVERLFGTMENDFGREWATYCGRGMSPDAERRMVSPRAAERDQVTALYPAFADYWGRLQAWFTRYNTERVHSALGCTPYEAWKNGVGEVRAAPDDALLLPRVERTPSRGEVRHRNRVYGAPELHALTSTRVWLEYDPWDTGTVRVLDRLTGRWLCDAREVVGVAPVGPERLAAQRARQPAVLRDLNAIGAQEQEQRALDDRTYDDVMDNLTAVAAVGGGGAVPPKTSGAGAATPAPDAGPGDVSLDLYRTDY